MAIAANATAFFASQNFLKAIKFMADILPLLDVAVMLSWYCLFLQLKIF